MSALSEIAGAEKVFTGGSIGSAETTGVCVAGTFKSGSEIFIGASDVGVGGDSGASVLLAVVSVETVMGGEDAASKKAGDTDLSVVAAAGVCVISFSGRSRGVRGVRMTVGEDVLLNVNIIAIAKPADIITNWREVLGMYFLLYTNEAIVDNNRGHIRLFCIIIIVKKG